MYYDQTTLTHVYEMGAHDELDFNFANLFLDVSLYSIEYCDL